MCRKLLCLASFALVLGLAAGPAIAQDDVDAGPLLSEINIRVISGTDDAEQHLDQGDMDITSSDLELPYEDGGDPATDLQAIGLRFVDVPVSKGGPVDSAYLEFEIDELKTGSDAPVNLIIEGELAANAAAFEDIDNNITDRPVTVAKVMWSVPAGLAVDDKTQTPDVSSIIQEIVDQNDWTPGNAIVLIIRDDPNNPSTGLRAVESNDGEGEAAPLLSMMASIDPTVDGPSPAPGTIAVSIAPGISTFISNDVPKAGQDLQATTPNNTPGKATSTLTVEDSVTIDDLNVELDITMSGNNADLDVYLKSPDGKQVELFSDVGVDQHHFRNTILDDQASTSIRNGSGPFRGIFKPEGRLSDFNGRDTAGTWQLRIEDDWTGGVATLNAWRIVVKYSIPVTLGWTPSPDPRVASQDVYLSSVLEDASAAGGAGLITNVAAGVDAVELTSLDAGTTYYWRVDSVGDDGTVYVGDVWSFTTVAGNVVIDKRIASEDDDCEEDLNPSKLGENDLGSSDIEMPYEDSGMVDPQIAGVRFTDIGLEAGQEVNSAFIRFQVDENSEATSLVNLLIEGELSPNPAEFVGGGPGTFNISSRPRTEANVLWSVPAWPTVGDQGPDQTTSDISVIIEELLGQEEWAAGNAMVFIISDDPCSPSEGRRIAEAGPGDDSALLHIEAVTEAANSPSPADGAIDVAQDADLSWLPGASSASRDVYFGTDSDPSKLERTTGTSWQLGKLAVSTTYYWKIDEYDADGNKTEGAVWSFTTILGEATNPDPADQALEVALDAVLGWTPGATAVASDIYFGVGTDLSLIGTTAETSFDTTLIGGLRVGNSYSWRIDSIEEDGTKHVGDVWTFSSLNGRASNPDPAEGALLEQTFALLQWTAGLTAASHNVYVSDNMDDVAAGAEAAFAGNLTETTLSIGLEGLPIPGGLAGATYFWRVDAVEADPNVVHEGEVWSFTVPPLEAYDPSPADGAVDVDVAGVTLSWTAGLGAKLHSVYFGDDPNTVAEAAGAPPLPLTTFDTGPLEQGKTYYWRVDEFNPPTNITGTVWSFSTPAPPEPEPEPEPEPLAKASDPSPADGADISSTFTILGWTGAAGVVSYNLYVSDSMDDVTAGAEAALAGNLADTSIIVGLPVPGMPVSGGLAPGKTYYWRVDEVEADGTVTEGDVWSFNVAL